MSGIGISSVINASFINSFRGLASSSSNSSRALAAALNGQSSSSTSISDGLRFGARTFSTAIQGLNTAISFVNLSQSTLKDLLKITDKAISLAQRACDSGASEDERRKLNLEFQKLGNKFGRIVAEAKLGDKEYLTEEGLAELLTNLGLNKDDSASVAAVFARFVLPDGEEAFASESMKVKRPVEIPPGAFRSAPSGTEFRMTKVTDNGGFPGFISTVNNVFNDIDDILNQNPGVMAVFTENAVGSLTTQGAGTLTGGGLQLLSTNPNTGYSVAASTKDFLGFNPDGYEQLFLLDPTGEVVHQVTNNSSYDVVFVALETAAADVSDDNLAVVYRMDDLSALESRMMKSTATAVGDDPTGPSVTHELLMTVGPGGGDFAAISNDGQYVVYSGEGDYHLKNLAGVEDAAFNAAGVSAIGFLDSGVLAVLDGSDIKEYTYGVGFGDTIASGLSGVAATAALEKNGGSMGYVGWYDSSTRTAYVKDQAGTTVASYSLQAGDSLTGELQLAFNARGDVDIGLVARVPSYNGDSNDELYRVSKNPQYETGRRYSRSAEEAETIFEGSLLRRSDAYVALADLKALREQIDKNLSALDELRKMIGDNMDLVRATGLAFLSIADELSGEEEADAVAAQLRKEIRRNAPAALAQAENLEPIAVAALALAGS